MGGTSGESTRPLLSIEGVSVRFGGVVALDNVSLDVGSAEIFGLIGPNGAGKSTLFNCISRVYNCSSGNIYFNKKIISTLPRHEIMGRGIGRTFQNLALFPTMSVLENVLVGAQGAGYGDALSNTLSLPRSQRLKHQALEAAWAQIETLGLVAVAGRCVAELPFAAQKRVELARAMASHPKLLLLDEPACGLNHEEVEALGEIIRKIRDRSRTTVLLVEHHMGLVMSLSQKVAVLNFGRKIAEGEPREIQEHPGVIRAYLGDDEDGGGDGGTA